MFLSQKIGNRHSPSCSYFKYIWDWASNFGDLELPNLHLQSNLQPFSHLLNNISDGYYYFTIRVAISSAGDKHTISQQADGSKVEAD